MQMGVDVPAMSQKQHRMQIWHTVYMPWLTFHRQCAIIIAAAVTAAIGKKMRRYHTMGRSIRVTGKGKIALQPDMIRLILHLEDTDPDYEQIMAMSATQTNALKACIEQLGFAKSDMKTLSFGIKPQYEGYHDEKNNWKQRFVGYQFQHRLKLEMDADNAMLGKVLSAIAATALHPNLDIIHTVRDTEAAKNRLLGNAVADATEKAKVLAQAAGLTLGSIVTMDYSWGEIEFTSQPIQKEAVRCISAMPNEAIDIDPDDIEVSDIVTITWNIG